jgi:DNA-binding transcriptional LysR family regulator
VSLVLATCSVRFADVPPEWGTRILVDRAFEEAGIARTIDYEVNDTATVIDFVREGLAVTIVAPSFGGATVRDTDGDDGRGLVLLPFRGRAPQSVMSIVTPTDRPLGAAARALRDIALGLAEEEERGGRAGASRGSGSATRRI